MVEWPSTRRMIQMTNAVSGGIVKADFEFESDDERWFCDRLVIDIQDIKDKGMMVMLPRE